MTSVLPHLNAFLNAVTFALIAFGLAAIKRRNELLHKRLMLAAVAAAVLFLISYLTYHFLAGMTRYQGEGALRTAYFAILWSHTVLAVVQVPLIVATVVLGLRDRRAAHRRLARITAPIWLYVNATGIVIYWMLYRL
jgi:putative membrane protein